MSGVGGGDGARVWRRRHRAGGGVSLRRFAIGAVEPLRRMLGADSAVTPPPLSGCPVCHLPGRRCCVKGDVGGPAAELDLVEHLRTRIKKAFANASRCSPPCGESGTVSRGHRRKAQVTGRRRAASSRRPCCGGRGDQGFACLSDRRPARASVLRSEPSPGSPPFKEPLDTACAAGLLLPSSFSSFTLSAATGGELASSTDPGRKPEAEGLARTRMRT